MNTPIFDQLVEEFASVGKRYEDMTRSYYRQPKPSTAPVAVPLDVLKAVAKGSEDETMSFAVVKPIAVVSLGKKGSPA